MIVEPCRSWQGSAWRCSSVLPLDVFIAQEGLCHVCLWAKVNAPKYRALPPLGGDPPAPAQEVAARLIEEAGL